MGVNFHIKTKDFDLTPDVSRNVHEKLGVIEKYLEANGDKEILAEVEIGLVSKHHKKGDVYRAEINVQSEGELYRAVSEKGSMAEAIDDLKDQIGKVIRRRLGKKDSLFRKGGRFIKGLLKK